MKLLTLAILLLMLSGCAARPYAGSRPNILVILVDDLGWRDLGPYGQDFAKTPRVDAFAAESAMFTAAYSAGTVCSPTRAALMTGQYPPRIPITDWIPGTQFPKARLRPPADLDALPLENTTLAEALRSVGYRTIHIGKWHLGGRGFLPEDQGFDVNLMGSHIGHPASHFFPYGNAQDDKPAASHAVPLNPLTGAAGEYLADRQAGEAAKLIRAVAKERTPFLMHLSFYAVHAPLEAPKSDVDRYARQKAALGEPAASQPSPRPVYAAMVDRLDYAVGRVLDELHATGLDRNTLVMLTSDNGGLSSATDNRPLRGGKRSVWEGGIRVPLLVRWPGVTTPRARYSTPVITQDLFATACDAAGVEIPAAAKEDSRSLADMLAGRGDSLDRDALYWHFPHNETREVGPRGAMRSGRWKLIEEYEDGSALLFDLETDPYETTDVSRANPEVAADLLKRFRAWREQVGAAMPTPNPKYEGPEAAMGSPIVIPATTPDDPHRCACVREAIKAGAVAHP